MLALYSITSRHSTHGPGMIGNIVVDTGHDKHAGDRNRRRQEPDEDGAAQPDLVRARTDQEPERQRDDYRGEPEIERTDVQCDRDKYVGGNQQDDRNQDVGERVNDVESDRRSYPFEARIDAVEVAMERVKLKNDLLDLENDRAHDPQIARAMLSRATASSLIVSAQKGHSIRRIFFASAERFEFCARLIQLQPQGVALARQFVTLGDQRSRHGDFARAGAANQRLGQVLPRAVWTSGAQGATFRTKLVVPTRPSVSLMSTRTMCSPAGSSTSGMSMPLGRTTEI